MELVEQISELMAKLDEQMRQNAGLSTEVDALKAQAELDCATIESLRCSLQAQALDLELLAVINVSTTPFFPCPFRPLHGKFAVSGHAWSLLECCPEDREVYHLIIPPNSRHSKKKKKKKKKKRTVFSNDRVTDS